MLTPKKISSVNCFNRLNYIRTFDGNYASGITEQLKTSFEESPDYTEVYKNYNFKKIYKTRIFEGNEKDKKLGFKYLQSYPYDTPQFKIGDYVHWKYDHINLSTWLMISLDTQHLYDVKGRILLCNNYLKWIDNSGKVISYECVFEDTLTYASFKYGESGVIQPNGTIVILVPQNEDTRTIYKNQRFLFNGVPYVVNNFIRSVNSNFLEIYMFESQLIDKDDVKNNIAYNGIEQDTEVTTSVTTITPNISEILENETQEFVIQRYLDGVKQDDTYQISSNGVPQENYTLTIINGNTFSITNNEQYEKKSLTISCLNETTNEITNIEIWLVGGW